MAHGHTSRNGAIPRWAYGLVLVLVLATTACAETLSSPERILTTRVLALRSRVIESQMPDPQDQAVRCEALPFETVELEPFVVGPEGPVDPTARDPLWIACNLQPAQTISSCVAEARPTTLADIPACPIPSPDEFDPTSSGFSEPPSPCSIGRGGTVEFTVPVSAGYLIGGDIEITMIAAGERTSSERCANGFLADPPAVLDDCLLATRALSIGPDGKLIELARELGVVGIDAPEQIPDADRNPRIVSFKVGVIPKGDGNLSELVSVERGSTIHLSEGDILHAETVASPDDLQTYFIIQDDGVEAEQERFDGSWFISWGRLASSSSDDPLSVNEWELAKHPDDDFDRPADNRAALYYVLRDGRQGVDWWWAYVDLP